MKLATEMHLSPGVIPGGRGPGGNAGDDSAAWGLEAPTVACRAEPGVTVGAGCADLGLEAAAGADRADLGPEVTAGVRCADLGPGVTAGARCADPGVAAGAGRAARGPGPPGWAGSADTGLGVTPGAGWAGAAAGAGPGRSGPRGWLGAAPLLGSTPAWKKEHVSTWASVPADPPSSPAQTCCPAPAAQSLVG